MKNVTLGTTKITVPQNGFGALPVQRVEMDKAVAILQRAYEGGMRFFDTARAYSDSEEKLGNALSHVRENIIIATKTMARTPEDFWEHLETSLSLLKTDYIDIYQFHMVDRVYAPGDGTGMYECMLEARRQGKIRHIGATAHKVEVAFDLVKSGLYETLQYPLSYLAAPRELELVQYAGEKNVGFIAMKGLAGGLINNSAAAMAFMEQYDNVIPIWGVQKMSELEEWLSYMEETPTLTPEMVAFIEQEKSELSGEFCRGCGYCMPCPMGIQIPNCARMSLMLRRAPSANWLSESWQQNMKQIEECIHCMQCTKKCPYELDTPQLLQKNLEDYRRVVSGEVAVD